ncbi:efflux RND transporter periplasmic adaptor subunit [Acinetobacter sp. ANC 3882]|uniref:efflux RND transporter periplasmic adaptor subunit n=1 Tax=Acinetobacter sp. ANC 3882 TaxID=2923423 RepID=UPI001F4AC6B5|nr:efflux RND transporter periplasmic adaptor subunit [Acinetobacter sp. ANC 3882]MCH7315606.1 efflux RND transporter periplasmic adaptor subunit [Acinetobacter sp. ANC 3882]
MKTQLRILLIIMILVVIAVAAYFYFKSRSANSPSSYSYPPVKVALSTVKQQITPRTLSSIGELEAIRQVQVSSESTGVIEQIYFQSGQYVKKGQLLVQLKTNVEQGNLGQLQAKLKQAEMTYNRTKQLIDSHAISRAEMDTALADRDMTRAEIQQLQATIQQKSIRAPFSGIIGIRQVHQGQYLQAGTGIANLVDTQQLLANFTLDEQLAARLKTGQSVQLKIDAFPEQSFSAVVNAIEPMISKSRTITGQATLNNQHQQLKPGMYAKLDIQEANLPSLVLPETAITYTAYGNTVFLVKHDNKKLTVQRVAVELGERHQGWVEVQSGVKAGDQVVVSGQLRLSDGMQVEATEDTLQQSQSTLAKAKI